MAQDLVVTEIDCGTSFGLSITPIVEGGDVVEAAVPVQRGHQEPERRAALLQKWHHQRLRGRLVPGARRQIP